MLYVCASLSVNGHDILIAQNGGVGAQTIVRGIRMSTFNGMILGMV